MLSVAEGLAAVIRAYLDVVREPFHVAWIQLDTATGEVDVLGTFDSPDDALAAAVADFRETAIEALDDDDSPTCGAFLRQVQVIAGEGGLHRLIRFREPRPDDLTQASCVMQPFDIEGMLPFEVVAEFEADRE